MSGEASTPAAEFRPASASPWILSSFTDLLLFVATPLLIVPLLLLTRQRFSDQAIFAFVSAFGATGHHLPGLLRAYGDRALFQRFRFRLTLIPALLLGISLPLLFSDLRQSMLVILGLWGFWHGMMQVYGFVRIYDAKAGWTDRQTARIDWLMCLAWFGTGLVCSQGRVYQLLDVYYQAGGPLIWPGAVEGFRNLWLIGTGLVTAGFFFHLARHCLGTLQTRRSPSVVKLMTMAISFAFWWFAMVEIDSIIIGIALFEIFHDVQYLAIVWIFNRKRVDQGAAVGGFTRFLFRRSWAMLGIYIGLVMAYGFASNLQEQLEFEPIKNLLIGLVWTSTLMHFYLDGFIWKVRERGTQASLGIGQDAKNEETRPLTEGLSHSTKWLPFLAAVAVLTTCQWWSDGVHSNDEDRQTRDLRRYQSLAQIVPQYPDAHLTLGTRLAANGDPEPALKAFRRSVALSPNHNPKGYYNLGYVLATHGKSSADTDKAIAHYRQAISQDPRYIEAHFALAAALQKQKDLMEKVLLCVLYLRYPCSLSLLSL